MTNARHMTRAAGSMDPVDQGATPLRLVIGFSPGSASDDMANLLAPALARELKRQVVIERMQGEDGGRAARFVAANPDNADIVLMATLGTHALRPHFEPHPGYDRLADFAPVIRLAQAPLVLATGAASPYRTLADVIISCKAKPGQRTFGASAIGGAPFLATELFRHKAGVDIHHTIYEQTAELYADLAAGRVDFSFNNLMSMLPRIRRGELRALAVTSQERIALLPEVPSLAASRLAGCVMVNWLGIVGPKGLPSNAVNDLNSACRRALAASDTSQAIASAGLNVVPGSPEEFGRFIEDELARWAPVARIAQDEAWSAAILSQS